jgi:hypothetical protein
MKLKDLCKCFKNIAPVVYWMAYIDENNITKRIRVMPHFIINDERQRINNCPQCGLHVRSLELNEEEYKQLTNESNNL